ncbi:MAG TPA: 2-oxo-4-hydroxy-4-carboxy-5-ureidoimidazoline decarboxylase [Caulobacteraceae bacterium]|nr:2-oxo-4-hydroxy-4-carboxy-5-ureidoimidazoline decarboxylase [Caulobacteraceae bacterium]
MKQPPNLTGRPVADGDLSQFVGCYGHLFEHSPWVVERAYAYAPFADAAALHGALLRVLDDASEAERLALVRAHPKLADKAAIAEGLTADSAAEQASAGLDRLSASEFEAFHALNTAYAERFGFPFIICVKLHHKAEILADMRERLTQAPQTELVRALTEIGLISRMRLADIDVGPMA